MLTKPATHNPPPDTIVFTHSQPPAPGTTVEVAPGVLWVKLALPFRLNHVNVYLIEDDEGFALIDTGLGNTATQAAWEALFAGPLAGRRLTRIIATHFHPDHVGAAGFLLQRFDVPLYMAATEYLQSLTIKLDPGALEAAHYRRFYLEHGLNAEATERVVTSGHAYLKLTSGLPPVYHRVVAGDVLRIGGRDFDVLTGGGHSPEEVMLVCRADNLFFAADQVLAKISPNVSVSAVDPQGDPLGQYLRSLTALKRGVAEDVAVLPGHNLPFRGLHRRIDELIAHHEARCGLILSACRTAPRSAAELIPFVFSRELDPHQTGFAFSEVLAHVNYLLRQGKLKAVETADGIDRTVAA